MTGGVIIRFLGPLEATAAGLPAELGGSRRRLVLATLLLAEGRHVSIDRLADVLWGDEPPPSARSQIAIHVSYLRKALGAPDVIETTLNGYRIRPEAAQIDGYTALELRRRAQAGDDPGANLGSALRLWRGPVLADMVEQELAADVRRWEELRLSVAEEWAEHRLSDGAYLDVLDVLTPLVAEHPLIERLRAQLITALWRAGRRAAALESYQEGRRVLVEELGLEPGRELRDLHDRMLREEPESRSFPRPAQLPPATPAFTGRAQEVRALDALNGTPVVVVSGVAGVGKTALALQWAHRAAARFDDGQLFADLHGYDVSAEPSSSHRVIERFLRALGLSAKDIPDDPDERAALYRSTLRGRRVLIVLDNAATAAQVRPLLPGAAGCLVVVTARRRLQGLLADGAAAVPLEVLTEQESSQLLARVSGAAMDGRVAARLGRLCDGLPLALRIAARLATRPGWSPAHIADRLEDERGRLDQLSRDEVHIRGTFSLSYDELSKPARTAFMLLSTVDAPAGFTPWLLAALLDGSLHQAEDLLEELVDAQLLQPMGRDQAGQLRYRCHDLIRLFAFELAESELTQAHRDAALERAFACLLALAEQANAIAYSGAPGGSLSGRAPRWLPQRHEELLAVPLDWLEVERATIVAGVEQAARMGWGELCWEIVACTAFLYVIRRHTHDYQAIIDAAHAVCRATGNRRGEAVMLRHAGSLLLGGDQHAAGAVRLREGLAIFDELGDDHGRARCLSDLGMTELGLGHMAAALDHFTRARVLLAELGLAMLAADALTRIISAHLTLEEWARARELALEGLATVPGTIVWVHANLHRLLAEAAFKLGDAQEALEASTTALALARESGHTVLEAIGVRGMGEAQLALGRREEGLATLFHSLELARALGDRRLEGRALLTLGEGGAEHAIEHLRAAVAIYEDRGLPVWAAKARAALEEARRRRTSS